MWVGFASIFLAIFGNMSFIFPLLFWQYMRMRYMLNGFSRTSFAYLRFNGDTLAQRAPGIVQKAWTKLKQLCD